MKSEFLKTALTAVARAEKAIMRIYSRPIRHTLKADLTPVTIADKQAEKIIIATIKARFPEHAFFGEEMGRQGNSEYTWVIDPIDGTKNFIRHIPLFGTQLALMKSGRPVLGVSNMPALKELIYAERGRGAFCNGRRIRVTQTARLADAGITFGGVRQFLQEDSLARLTRPVEAVHYARGIGDCWCYHLLAQGKIDGMIEARVSIWDVAAAAVIVTEAGGRATDLHGRELSFDSTNIMATNKRLHSAMLALVRPKKLSRTTDL